MAGIWLPSTRVVQPQDNAKLNFAFPKFFSSFIPSTLQNANFAFLPDNAVTQYGKAYASGASPVNIANNESFVLPSGSSATIIFVITSSAANSAYAGLCLGGTVDTGSTEFDFYPRYTDGNAYFRWAGGTTGTTSVNGLTPSISGIWVLSVGLNGMQIWRSGTLIAANSATPSRVPTAYPLTIGNSGGSPGINVSLFASLSIQLPSSINQSISTNPWQLFEDELTYIPISSSLYPTLSNLRFSPATSTGGYVAVDLS